MATLNTAYSSSTAITFDVSSLAGSATFVAGRESTQIDNTSNLYLDAQVYCDGITGHASTAPTVGQQIRLYVWGSDVSLATTPIDTLDGTDSAETLGHVAVRNDGIVLARSSAVTVATAGLVYYLRPFSVAAYFDGVLPPFWGLFLAHNHTGALAASQSGIWSYRGITMTSA